MRKAATKAATKNVMCSTTEDNIIPPILRILLNSNSPRNLPNIQYDYDKIECERQAALMTRGDDKMLEHKKPVTEPDKPSVVSDTKTGAALLSGGIRLMAQTLQVAGPNVNITIREAPTGDIKQKHLGVHTVHRLYMAAAFKVLLGGGAVGENTGVAALIVAPDGQILCWGKKNPKHSVLHAEASALIAYGQKLPRGVRIYSTLMPCQMCQAFIEHFSTDSDFLVYYGQYDPGGAASFAKDSKKYVCLTNQDPFIERPIYVEDKAKREGKTFPATVADKLKAEYAAKKEKEKKGEEQEGIIRFLKSGDVDTHLQTAANYLQVKVTKYQNPSLKNRYNENVQYCLAHITKVLKELNLREAAYTFEPRPFKVTRAADLKPAPRFEPKRGIETLADEH
jgi:tRNA(Arg) A34 adenosine deaminase TadA